MKARIVQLKNGFYIARPQMIPIEVVKQGPYTEKIFEARVIVRSYGDWLASIEMREMTPVENRNENDSTVSG